jgi:hypothetical protein
MLLGYGEVSGQIKKGFSQMCAVDEIHSEASKTLETRFFNERWKKYIKLILYSQDK